MNKDGSKKLIVDSLLIDDAVSKVDCIRAEAKKDKSFGFNWNFDEFLKAMYLLTSQAYGPRIQTRIINELKWVKIKASQNLGDALAMINNTYYEIKVSLISSSNSSMNLVQIRLWQNVNYLCFWFDIRTSKFSVYILTHDQMKAETELMMASAAHGTKEANEVNQNVELRLSIKIDENNENFKRWESKYKSNILDFLFALSKAS